MFRVFFSFFFLFFFPPSWPNQQNANVSGKRQALLLRFEVLIFLSVKNNSVQPPAVQRESLGHGSWRNGTGRREAGSGGSRAMVPSPGILGMFVVTENRGAPRFNNQDIAYKNKQPYCQAAGANTAWRKLVLRAWTLTNRKRDREGNNHGRQGAPPPHTRNPAPDQPSSLECRLLLRRTLSSVFLS